MKAATHGSVGVVYQLKFAGGKSYIGITRHKYPRQRYREHACAAKKGSNKAVHNAWRKHGPPEFIVIAKLPSEELCAAEQIAIRDYGTLFPGGYNLTTGGEMTTHTQESRRKLSLANTGKTRVGIPCCEETKRRISEANRGKKRTPEQRQRISESLVGRPGVPCTDEARLKISLSKIGRTKYQPPCSEETKKKLSIAHQGKEISPEHRAKISAALKGRPALALIGRPLSDSHREKLKKAWEVRRKREKIK